ncbi:hypothetical protein JYU34_003513 [Plutella xylostella]|uniref:Uncharacterized protein n=1 Tax=Plutella xylostella TaxID=51655 RepID=A0ABQ7R085_PLUXY|nr:hypothetical protein JYU34_003513 [Plutella xylostella]
MPGVWCEVRRRVRTEPPPGRRRRRRRAAPLRGSTDAGQGRRLDLLRSPRYVS